MDPKAHNYEETPCGNATQQHAMRADLDRRRRALHEELARLDDGFERVCGQEAPGDPAWVLARDEAEDLVQSFFAHNPPNLHRRVPEGYAELADILDRALHQAAGGKGKERHANGRPFTQQPMQQISDMLGSSDGLRYQAMKKVQESTRLPHDRAVAELLGAIVYTAGAILNMERNRSGEGDG